MTLRLSVFRSGMKRIVHPGDHGPVVIDAVAVHFPDDQAAQAVFVDIIQFRLQGGGAVIGIEGQII